MLPLGNQVSDTATGACLGTLDKYPILVSLQQSALTVDMDMNSSRDIEYKDEMRYVAAPTSPLQPFPLRPAIRPPSFLLIICFFPSALLLSGPCFCNMDRPSTLLIK